MTEIRKLRVFLCHSSQDKPIVRELYKRLNAEGWIDPWLDEKKLLPGSSHWTDQIEAAVETADAVIVFLSNNSVTNEGIVQKEIKKALDKADEIPEGEIFFIPLRIADCPIPRRIKNFYQYQDYFGDEELAYTKLCFSLKERARNLSIDIDKIKEEKIKKEKEDQLRLEIEERVRREEEKIIRRRIEKEVREALEEIARKQTLEALEQEKAERLQREEEERARKKAQEEDVERNKLFIQDLEFVKIPAGDYLMGSDEIPDANPKHTAQIQYDYWIGRFPVTNWEFVNYIINIKLNWEEIIREIRLGILFFSILRRTNIRWLPKFLLDKKNIPVSSLSYIEIVPYINWLNKQLNKGLPKGYKFSLPSEYEWEKAARGVDGNIYPWGDKFGPDRCNTKESHIYHKTPVDAFLKLGDSIYGASDMSGNVWEWTRSIFKDYKEEKLEQTILGQLDTLVLRGGSFKNKKTEATTAFRRSENPQAKAGYLGGPFGFRVVIIPNKKEEKNSLW